MLHYTWLDILFELSIALKACAVILLIVCITHAFDRSSLQTVLSHQADSSVIIWISYNVLTVTRDPMYQSLDDGSVMEVQRIIISRRSIRSRSVKKLLPMVFVVIVLNESPHTMFVHNYSV